MQLPEKIKKLRKKVGLSQKALGDELGISDKAVSKWEQGVSKPSLKNVFALARIFGVSVEYFVEEEKTFEKDKAKYMESITELYKIGRGPSSSHTIGPERAAMKFKEKNPDADRFDVILYGSLAKTGRGHCTDTVLKKTFSPIKCTVKFNCDNCDVPHPNTMDFAAYKGESEIDRARVFSIGGGSVSFEGEKSEKSKAVYEYTSFSDIANYCKSRNIRLCDYVFEKEKDILPYLGEIWSAMKKSVEHGLAADGILPGGLSVKRKAKILFETEHMDEAPQTRENRLVCAYAYAVGEENAAGETIVTAPTCGAAGVLPAVLYYYQSENGFTDMQIIRALACAAVVGNVIKTNGSISGAECGCQAEIGSACAMAAAAIGELFRLGTEKIEYAAEIAIEHHLGLTCDPVCGLVQIPCIERNAVAAMRAINAAGLASFLWDSRKISFDNVVKTMKQTGLDMSRSYKETSEAGLSKIKIK